MVKQHKSIVISKEKVGEDLPWVHIAISNAKRRTVKYYLKGKHKDLASKILAILKIKQPSKLMTEERVNQYLSTV